MFLNKITDYYKRFETYISIIGFSFGLVFTFLTLTRVDMWLENFWIIVNLLIVAFSIFALVFYENWTKNKNLPSSDEDIFHFYLSLFIQFAFGGLFATFFVFYVRSASFSDSWLFLLALLVLLVGNEIWKKHYQRLAFQISILFISLYLFLVFLLPVIFHRLGSDLFILAGIFSLLIAFLFTLLLRKFAQEKFKQSHNYLKISLSSIFILMNALYFTDIIPPIPLALKTAGVYHGIIKDESGNYLVQSEPSIWSDYFTRYPVFHASVGQPVYVFSAIFSPVKFASEIVHQWQYYDEVKKAWVDSTKVTLSITGGREEGFRTYSVNSLVNPSLWRVKVMTPSGQTLGKINFKVEGATSALDLVTEIL
jgi:hypothetical protein